VAAAAQQGADSWTTGLSPPFIRTGHAVFLAWVVNFHLCCSRLVVIWAGAVGFKTAAASSCCRPGLEAHEQCATDTVSSVKGLGSRTGCTMLEPGVLSWSTDLDFLSDVRDRCGRRNTCMIVLIWRTVMSLAVLCCCRTCVLNHRRW